MCPRVHSRHALPLACLGVLAWAAAHTPLYAQVPSAAATAAEASAQERAQRQSDSVYRWIKLHAEPSRKAEPVKPRPKPDAPAAVARKPDRTVEPEVAPTAPDAIASTEQPAPSSAPAEAMRQEAPTLASLPARAVEAPAPAPVEAVEVALKAIAQPQPEFPRELRSTVSQGRVTLAFTVQTDGTVSVPSVVSSTNRRLNRPALDAIARWRFEPIRVAQSAQVEIEFNLQ